MTFRVPLMNQQQSSKSNYRILLFVRKIKISSFSRVLKISFPFGFSSKMIFLLWCVFGGLLLHFFECNLLDILLKTNYEKPVDSAQDVLDRNLTNISPPGFGSEMIDLIMNSQSEIHRKIAERTVVPKVIS